MSNNSNNNENTKGQIFIWSKSEKAGKICYESHYENGWLYFTDGSRINSELIDEFMIRASNEDEANQISSEILGVSPSQQKNEKLNQKEKNQQNQQSNKDNNSLDKLNDEEKNKMIVMEMLSQVSKKNKDDIPIKVNLPAINVFNMLKDQMDKDPDELKSLITDLIEKQIDENRNNIKEQIFEYVKQYYEFDLTNKVLEDEAKKESEKLEKNTK